MTLTPQYTDLDQRKQVRRYGERVLYTDGSYGQGVSGWAVVENGECVHQDWARGLTSNLAEGMAILAALGLVQGGSALILSDSQGWVSALTNNKPIRGKGAKEIHEQAMELLHPLVSIQWIPAHTGNIPGNELADSMAKMARCCRLSY